MTKTGKKILLSLAADHDTGIAAYGLNNNLNNDLNSMDNANAENNRRFNIKQVFCVNEERLNRDKLTRHFPEKSVKEAVRFFKEKNIEKNKEKNTGEKYPVQNNFDDDNIEKILIPSQLSLASLRKIIFSKKLNISTKKIQFIKHSLCYAAGAYYTSGFQEALVFTLNTAGKDNTQCINISVGKNRTLKQIFLQGTQTGFSLFFSKITQLLGFEPGKHEGKTTGLAAYGKVDKKLLEDMKKIFIFDKNKGEFSKRNFLSGFNKTHSLYRNIKRFKKQHIAATAQYHLEQEICKFVNFWIKKTGIRNVCLAGGTFANVKLNQRIHELENIENIFIFPHMGDGGLAFGALTAYLKPKPFRLSNLYFGPGFSDAEIRQTLIKKKVGFEFHKDIEKKIAELLSKGKVVARFNGRMEFGPRALGSRSILCQAIDKDVNDWLNKKLKRSEFMPFAPSVIDKYAKKCFRNTNGAEYTAKFMTITFECTDYMKKMCPGVVHVDGTARPQIVSRKDTPSLYRILEHYHRLTGIPAIINTSFNMHEEPIVCSPDDAIKSFQKAGLKYHAIGNYLVKTENSH